MMVSINLLSLRRKTKISVAINSAAIELDWGGGGGGGGLPYLVNLLLNLASCPAKMDFEVGKSVCTSSFVSSLQVEEG